MNPTNVCRHLRTKKMFIPAQADEAFVVADGGTEPCGHCWCNVTLTPVGPDDHPVGSEVCVAPRICFEE
jgi:hypothetical protein